MWISWQTHIQEYKGNNKGNFRNYKIEHNQIIYKGMRKNIWCVIPRDSRMILLLCGIDWHEKQLQSLIQVHIYVLNVQMSVLSCLLPLWWSTKILVTIFRRKKYPDRRCESEINRCSMTVHYWNLTVLQAILTAPVRETI